MRRAVIDRRTAETQIKVTLALDGKGRYDNHTGIRFLDHMLDLVARHGGFDLKVAATGDLDLKVGVEVYGYFPLLVGADRLDSLPPGAGPDVPPIATIDANGLDRIFERFTDAESALALQEEQAEEIEIRFQHSHEQRSQWELMPYFFFFFLIQQTQ